MQILLRLLDISQQWLIQTAAQRSASTKGLNTFTT